MFTPFGDFRFPKVAWLVAFLMIFGCSVHRKGLVERVGAGTFLLEMDERRTEMIGIPLTQGLDRLDGHMVEVWGKKGPSALKVEKYRVLQGTHGLAHWVGEVRVRDGIVGILDVEGSQFRPIFGPEESALKAKIGCLVLIEGYIEGAGDVRVVYYRILAESGD